MRTNTNSDITARLERLEAMEDKVGITLDGLYAELRNDDGDTEVIVNGEVHSAGSNRDESFSVQVAIYDGQGRVMATESTYFSSDFCGFDTFSVRIDCPKQQISKIRIFPKP